MLTILAARIIANQPLQAKEAPPFVSSQYPVIVRTNWELGKKSDAAHRIPRITSTMLSLLELAARDCAQHLGSQKQDSIQHAYQSSSQLEVIPLPPKGASMLHLGSEYNILRHEFVVANRYAACTRTIGDGTCTIQ